MTEPGSGRSLRGGPALHAVRGVRDLSPSTYLLRLDRADLAFEPGQWVNIGLPGSGQWREYTICSPPGAGFLEVLIREIQAGTVSRRLRRLNRGDVAEVEGPHGCFGVPPEARAAGRNLFVATGTGISPFRCFASSYPGLRYEVLHGVRADRDLVGHEGLDASRVTACVSREEPRGGVGRPWRGRVTEYLRCHPVEPGSFCYLCGNSDMIYEALAILLDQGVPRSRILAEIYF